MKKINFKSIGMRAAGVAAGGAAGSIMNKMLPTLNPKIRAGIKIALGCVLPELASKNKLVADAGVALAGVGAYELANTFLNPGTGVQGIGEDPEYTVNGEDEYKVEGSGDYVFGNNDAMSGNDNDAMGDTGEGF